MTQLGTMMPHKEREESIPSFELTRFSAAALHGAAQRDRYKSHCAELERATLLVNYWLGQPASDLFETLALWLH